MRRLYLVVKPGAGAIECHGRPAGEQVAKQLPRRTEPVNIASASRWRRGVPRAGRHGRSATDRRSYGELLRQPRRRGHAGARRDDSWSPLGVTRVRRRPLLFGAAWPAGRLHPLNHRLPLDQVVGLAGGSAPARAWRGAHLAARRCRARQPGVLTTRDSPRPRGPAATPVEEPARPRCCCTRAVRSAGRRRPSSTTATSSPTCVNTVDFGLAARTRPCCRRAALPRRRRRRRAQLGVGRSPHRVARPLLAEGWLDAVQGEPSPTPSSSPPCWPASSSSPTGRPRSRRCATCPTAGRACRCRCLSGRSSCSRRGRLRQRLRPDGDELDDRPPRSRRAPDGRAGDPVVRRPLASVGRPMPGVEVEHRRRRRERGARR